MSRTLDALLILGLLPAHKQKINSPCLPTTGKQIPGDHSEHFQGDDRCTFGSHLLCPKQGKDPEMWAKKAVHKT